MDLTEPQQIALYAIAASHETWPLREEVESGLAEAEHDPGALDDLIDLGLASLWERPGGTAIVLTSDAATMLGLVTEEHWEYRSEAVEPTGLDRILPGKRPRVRVASGVPRWTLGEMTAPGPKEPASLAPRRRRVRVAEGTRLRERPVMPPIFAQEAPPAFLVERTKPPPKGHTVYVADWADGETTTDPAKAKKLCGVAVEVDRRRQRHRVVDHARRAKRAEKGAGR